MEFHLARQRFSYPPWIISGEGPWTVSGPSLDCPWTIIGPSLDRPWNISGLFSFDHFNMIHPVVYLRLRKLYKSCMAIFLICSVLWILETQ